MQRQCEAAAIVDVQARVLGSNLVSDLAIRTRKGSGIHSTVKDFKCREENIYNVTLFIVLFLTHKFVLTSKDYYSQGNLCQPAHVCLLLVNK